MFRTTLALAALATTSGTVAGILSLQLPSPVRAVAVVGRERPLNLGGMVVTATELPQAR